MVTSCCAYNCKERKVKGSPYTFHKFPHNETRRRDWEKRLRREGFTATESSRICSKHFEKECFDEERVGRVWLKSDAVPTKFDFPNHLVEKEKVQKQNERLVDPTSEPISTASAEENKNLKRKYFLGDFEENDMDSPLKARRVLQMAKEQQKISKKKIKELKQKNAGLQKKVESLRSILEGIQSKLLIKESAKSILEDMDESNPPSVINVKEEKPDSEILSEQKNDFAFSSYPNLEDM